MYIAIPLQRQFFVQKPTDKTCMPSYTIKGIQRYCKAPGILWVPYHSFIQNRAIIQVCMRLNCHESVDDLTGISAGMFNSSGIYRCFIKHVFMLYCKVKQLFSSKEHNILEKRTMVYTPLNTKIIAKAILLFFGVFFFLKMYYIQNYFIQY